MAVEGENIGRRLFAIPLFILAWMLIVAAWGIFGSVVQGREDLPPFGYELAALAVAAAAVYWIFVLPTRRRAKREEAAERELGRQRAKKEKMAEDQKRQEFDTVCDELVRNAASATANFNNMPRRLQAANEATARAKNSYEDGAFSPFWSEIEKAYAALARYVEDVTTVRNCAMRHRGLSADYRRLGGAESPVTTFPITLDVDAIDRVVSDASANLGAMVYEAQKHPTYAQIWEQRRTTAAVVRGFANLEAAVNDMSDRVTSAVSLLGSELRTVHSQLNNSVQSVAIETRSASTAQNAHMRELIKAAQHTQHDIHHQVWHQHHFDK